VSPAGTIVFTEFSTHCAWWKNEAKFLNEEFTTVSPAILISDENRLNLTSAEMAVDPVKPIDETTSSSYGNRLAGVSLVMIILASMCLCLQMLRKAMDRRRHVVVIHPHRSPPTL
jgi:hypothetical protein